jgi:hypothetical protein
MKPRPVLARWADSCHWGAHGAWHDRKGVSDATSPCEVLTVGWLIASDDDSITVVQSLTEADDVAAPFVIPRGCLLSLVALKPKGKP